jgi:hypothetical protein
MEGASIVVSDIGDKSGDQTVAKLGDRSLSGCGRTLPSCATR